MRQNLARLARLSINRTNAIGAGLYHSHCNRMLCSREVKAAALASVVGIAMSDDEVWEHASRIDMFAPHDRPVRWFNRMKRPGKVRTICLPDVELKARQRAITAMIVAQQSPDPQIFNWKERGCSRQANQIKAALEGRRRYVLAADVRDCFPSVNFDAVYDLNLMPIEAIRYASDSRHLNFVHEPSPQVRNTADDHTPLCDGINEQVGPRGLLQGFGSSDALWVSLIGDLPDRLIVHGVPFIYCDNIAVVCETLAEAADAEETLARYFSDHSAGPLSLTTEVHDAHEGFEHTGYRFSRAAGGGAGSALVTPSVPNLVKLLGRLQSDVRAKGAGKISTREAEQLFATRLSGFSATSEEYRDELLSSFIAEIDARDVAP